MAINKIFTHDMRGLNDQVVAMLHPSPFLNNGSQQFFKIVRNTVGDDAILQEMTNHTDIARPNDMITVMTAFIDAIKSILANGNAVQVGDLGTFYLSCPGGFEYGSTQTTAELSKRLRVCFKPSAKLQLAVSSTVVSAIIECDNSPVITSITDMDTYDDSTLQANRIVRISGLRLRLAGAESDDCGVYFVPADSNHDPDMDTANWKRVSDTYVYKNRPSELLVRVPALTQGSSFFIAIRTVAPAAGGTLTTPPKGLSWKCEYVDPACYLKRSRFCISEDYYDVT